ncbi:MAG: hypothetical protein ABEI57_06435 [Halapricum sp.]
MRARFDHIRPAGDRGQAFTLEAVVAAVVVLGGLLFALQVSGVTALTSSTASGAMVQQQETLASGILDAAAASDSIRPMLLYWDDGKETFYGPYSDSDGYYTVGPPTAFGSLLNETLDGQSVALNVDLHYVDANGTVQRRELVRNGEPSDDAARATRTVTLYDDDRLLNGDGTVSNTTLANASFYLPDRYPDGPIYNVVRVEVVVWPV